MCMSNATTLGARPSDPSKISFARECFEVVGSESVFSVERSALHSAPATFPTREAAEAFASRCGRPVTKISRPVMRRVRWS